MKNMEVGGRGRVFKGKRRKGLEGLGGIGNELGKPSPRTWKREDGDVVTPGQKEYRKGRDWENRETIRNG